MPIAKDNDTFLPTRDGKEKKPVKGVPFALYINGELVHMSKSDALGLLGQITNILCYQDAQEQENGD